MPWWRKSVRGFSLYSEDLLSSKAIRWQIIIIHLVGFVLGITAVVIGVFSYAQNTPGGATIQYVNCSLTIDLNSNINVDFPLRLLLVLTGALLVAIDINISILFCFFKFCGCGGLAVIWYIVECLCLLMWTTWSVFYVVSVYPTWQVNPAFCEHLVMISTITAVAVTCLFTLLYLTVVVIVVTYESWERIGCCYSCCSRTKYDDND